jgi:cytochrome c
MTGPNLHGVFGRPAAQVDKFKYSDVLKTSGIVWDASHLDEWLAKPQTYLPGTKMSFAGLKDPKDRADLIAWLMVETGYKPAPPS